MTTVNLNPANTSAASALAISPAAPSTTTQAQAASTASDPSAAAIVTVTLSSNAQRLQTAVANLASDEASSPTGALASQWDQDLADSVGSATEAAADAEVTALPSSDPAHLAQAQAAQAYVKNRITSGANPSIYNQVPNPFAGLSQTQLAAIANDKSGLYTSYEKSAALYESQDQTNAWVLSQQNDPQGQNQALFQDAQQEYDFLSPLQQSAYPIDYLNVIENLKNNDGYV